jgi:hypothetical protein
MENIYTVLMTAITVIGGSAAWRYYEKRAQKKEEDDRWIKNDCTSRITKLEALLAESSKEKDEMRGIILNLTAQVAELRTKVEYLQSTK